MSIPLRRYWALLVSYLRPQKPRVFLLAFLLIGSIGLQLVNPQLVRYFIDTATTGGDLNKLIAIAGAFVGVALVNQAVAVGATYLSETIGWTATNALRTDLAAHCLGLDLSFQKTRTPGEMIQRIDGDVDALSNFFSQFSIYVLSNLLLLCGVLVLLYREDWRVGLGMTGFALFALVVMVRIRAFAIPHWTALREMTAQFYGFLGEHLAGTEDIRANGARPYVMRRLYEMFRRWYPIQRRQTIAYVAMNLSSLAIFGAGNAVALGLGAYLWNQGAITIGAVYLIFNYTEMLRRPIEQIRTQLQDLQTAEASIGRVEELFRTETRIKDGPGVTLAAGPPGLEFRDVGFAYEPGEPVLERVSFELGPGRVLGVLGRTGSGKTTLARLILRLYDADSGEVLLGGAPVRDFALGDLRRRVGLVTQDVQLFDATARDNLTFFDPAVPDERLLSVIDDLGLGDWYGALPNGLDSRIEGNGGLSAGEAQLLAFARVFLADPGIVILDEASSRLDRATERLIERAVDRLLEGRTGIIIAHRLGTLDRVDDVLVLERGQVVEQGERAALAGDPGSHFARLLEAGLEAAPA